MSLALQRFSPQLQLETLYELDGQGRIVQTREPGTNSGPAFALVRSRSACAFAVHASVNADVADELAALARVEPPVSDLRDSPAHASRYVTLLTGRVESGPAFTFPMIPSVDVATATISDLSQLERHFRGWTAEELPERSPIVAITENGYAVSVCFCARRSAVAAEAGLETAAAFRGRGFGPQVTAAWAHAISASGRLPIYSTSWTNDASLAVARKLGLEPCASDWNVYT